MTQSSRRNFLKTSAVGVVAITGTSGVMADSAKAQLMPPKSTIQSRANEISTKLFADDGLAIPIATKPMISSLAKGLDRTMVLGGGGEYYIAWYCGFFHGLIEAGLDMVRLPEMVVGTSAGSYMGSSLLSGEFNRLRTEFDVFGKFPGIFSKMAPLAKPNISQIRADQINMSATDGSIETRKIIGNAALAANNKLNGDHVERLAALLTGDSKKIGRQVGCIQQALIAIQVNVLSWGNKPLERMAFPWHMVRRQAAPCQEWLDQHYWVSVMSWMGVFVLIQHTWI